MNKLNSRKIIEKIEKEKGKLKEKGVKKIALFGSYANDKQNKKSDIDFLIEFEKINFHNYMYILNFLRQIFKCKIDLVIEKDLKPELNYVKKEARYVKI